MRQELEQFIQPVIDIHKSGRGNSMDWSLAINLFLPYLDMNQQQFRPNKFQV